MILIVVLKETNSFSSQKTYIAIDICIIYYILTQTEMEVLACNNLCVVTTEITQFEVGDV